MYAYTAVRPQCVAAAYEIRAGRRCQSQRVRSLTSLREEGDEGLLALRYLLFGTQCLNNPWRTFTELIWMFENVSTYEIHQALVVGEITGFAHEVYVIYYFLMNMN